MGAIAQDSNNKPQFLSTDSTGKLLLGAGTSTIGNVNEARGKTILYDKGSAAAATATMRTVTAGKTYYLIAAGIGYHSTTDNVDAIIWVADATKILLRLTSHVTATYFTSDTATAALTFPHPIPIAAGTVIQVYSGHANLTADGWIIGWEE